LHTQALNEIEQYGWTIISENVLCILLEKTNDTKQLHFNFGLLIRLLEMIDTKSNDYKEMKEKPFISNNYYSRDEYFYNGMVAIILAARNLPLDMFFLLLERYKFKGDSKLYEEIFSRKLPFPVLFSTLKRLMQNGIQPPYGFHYDALKISDKDQMFQLVSWGVRNWIKSGFFAFYHHFGERLFEEPIPNGKTLWIDWLWEKGFMNSRNFRVTDTFQRYDNMKIALNKIPGDQSLRYRLFKYLISKDFRFFPKNMLDEAIGHHDVKSAVLFVSMGYKIQNLRLTWLDIVKPDRNLPYTYFSYKEEDDTGLNSDEFKDLEKKHYSEAIKQIVFPVLIWLHETFPFTEDEFYGMSDCFSHYSRIPVIYNWLYENNPLVKFYNDDNDGFYARRYAKRDINENLPRLRKELKEKKDQLVILKEEEAKLSDFIMSYIEHDTSTIWVIRLPELPEIPEVPELGSIEDWQTVSYRKKPKSKRNQARLKRRDNQKLRQDYEDQLANKKRVEEERKRLIEERKRITLRNTMVDEINDAVEKLKILRLEKIRYLRRKVRKNIKIINSKKENIRNQDFEIEDNPDLDGRVVCRYDYDDDEPVLYCVGYESDDDWYYMDDPKYEIDYW